MRIRQLTNKDGRSYTFDERGAGYARGEGVGVLVLKRLDRAVADGDYIHAVLLESGVGHDGKTSGIFLPNSSAQEALARSVYSRAGLNPLDTLFVESHGTGTVAGDNAEVGSIGRVFGRAAGRTTDLPIGSIKTNIGHLEAASGVASAIKAIMVLKKNQIPPQLNFINEKPGLDLEKRGLKVPLELMPLAPEDHTGPRRVSVNSFGYGGTNAHAILQGYDFEPQPTPNQSSETKPIVFSANSESSLKKLITNTRQWLQSEESQSVSFTDLAYTLNTRRSKLPWRCSAVASSVQELDAALGDAKLQLVKSSRDVALAFVFTGQGAQWYAMGRELLASSQSGEFAASIAHSNNAMKVLGCEWDLVEELSRDEDSSRLGEARFAQPATTAVQIAMVDLLANTYGIQPEAVCGHSSGEIAAAYAAGALSRDAAMQVSYMRGICSAKAKTLNSTPGGMLAVGEGPEDIGARIKKIDSSFGKIVVACVNSPESTTISGDVAALEELQAVLSEASVFNRRIKVDSAYHSHHMEVVAPSYLSSLDGLVTGETRDDVAFFSSVAGVRKTSGFGAEYWVSNLVSQVKFSTASQLVAQHVSDTHSSGINMLIEVGPHAALSGPLRQSLSDANFKLPSGASFKYTYAPCLIRNTSALKSVLSLAGKVFESGSPVRLDTKKTDEQPRVVPELPSYPWDHSNTYWRESRLSKKNRMRPFPPHDLLGLFEVASSPYEPRWRYHVSLANTPWLRDHVIEGFMIFPGAGYLIMTIEAMKQLFQLRNMPGRIANINFQNIVIANPVIIHDDDNSKESQVVELQLIISPSRQHSGSSWEHFRVISYDSQNDSWIDNCSGLVSWDSVTSEASAAVQPQVDSFSSVHDEDGLGHLSKAAAQTWLRDIQAVCHTPLDAAETYLDLKTAGNEYGETFQGMKEIHVGDGFATAKVIIPDITQFAPGHSMQPHTIHPSVFDSLFQLEPVCFRREGLMAPIMPTNLGQISVAADMDSAPGTEIMVALQHFQHTPRDSTCAFYAYQKMSDGSYRPVVTCNDARSQAVGEGDADDDANNKMTYRMDWRPDIDFMTESDLMALSSDTIPLSGGGSSVLSESHVARIKAYMEALVHKSPNMDVLVIGSGPSSDTISLMEAIECQSRLPLTMYTYTDVSPELVEQARDKFSEWIAPIDFKKLDISQDPIPQGLTAHGFDLIVASMLSYTATGRDIALGHVKKLMRPGGRLVLLESTAVATSGSERTDEPLISISQWETCLKDHGFGGLDFTFSQGDDDSSALMMTRLLSSATETTNSSTQQVAEKTMEAKVLLGHSESADQIALTQVLSQALKQRGVDCTVERLNSSGEQAPVTIVIDSVEHPLLLSPSPETFQQIKELLLRGGDVLWLSFQASDASGSKAAFKKMAGGMARVLRRENPSLRLITVDVQDVMKPSADQVQGVVRLISDVTMLSFWSPEGTTSTENEYVIRDGKLLIPRVLPDEHLSTHIDSRVNPQHNMGSDAALLPCSYLDKGRPIKFDIRVPGLLKTIRFVDNDEMLNPLGPDEVQIEARAYGVNFKDVLIALGQMPPATQMTGEIAGVITAVGSNVSSHKIGDRVTSLFVTQLGNQVRVKSSNVVTIPDSISFTDAASIPLIFVTAWYCLNQVARLEKGQRVLIHAGSGGVGQAAIQLAQLVGAEVFTTVGSAAKKTLVKERYGLDDSHIFSSRSGVFKKQIFDATQGMGVDVVLNSLSGQLLRDSWDCLAPFGTFCEIGKADIIGRGQLNMAKFDKQATFAAVDVFYMHQNRPERVVRGINEVLAMVDQGLLRSVHPVTTFDMSAIEQAFSLMAERKHMGKLVLLADESTLVQATRPKAPVLRLQQEGSYVIGGGLGDIGKKIGRFLVEKGAGHIVALTRRDADSVAQQPAIVEFMEVIKNLGGTLHILQCDIADESSTRNAAAQLVGLGLPQVRGIIQSATVLRDRPWENMKVDDWNESVKPKVQGTLNMNEFFCSPETTDFFVMLSSVASIVGSASQSNYAAGNAFLEAFAHAQTQASQGITKYTAVNVGAVEGSELIAGVQDQGIDITNTIGSVSFDEVLAALEYAMNPQARADHTVVQHLMHFSRDKLEASSGPWALSDPLYDHIPSKMRLEGRSASKGGDGKKQTILQAVEEAETVAEAEVIVKQALLDKFEAFIGDDVPDIPIAALGLDSLVSIELKNWVRHTFKTPLQISELTSAPSMLALAKLIISRMVLKFNPANSAVVEAESDKPQSGALTPIVVEQPVISSESSDAVLSDDATDETSSVSEPDWHGQNCCKAYKDLPVMPLPDLGETLDYWLESNGHLFGSEQLESINRDIDAIRAPGSSARKILSDLYEKHADDSTNAWFTDIVTNARFLCRRAPVAPWTSIMISQRDNPGKRHSQVERAAIIASATVSFKRAVDAGKVEPLEIAGKPECTWGWSWLFNSTRVPQPDCDKVVSHASRLTAAMARDHVAVLRKGRVFKVMLQNEASEDVSMSHLQTIFEAIVAQVEGEDVLAGLLTTDERESWAKVSRYKQ